MNYNLTNVAPNVELVTVGESQYYDGFTPTPNVYFVTGSEGVAIIDAGYGKDEEIRAYREHWESKGKPPVKAIVLTHRHGDHIGGAKRLHEVTDGPLSASVVEQGPIEDELKTLGVGRVVADGERLNLGGATLEFIATPGHTMGSICIFYREQDVLFTGDTILGSSTTVISPEHGDMTAYMDSLKRLLGYEARVIAPGHGPINYDPKPKIEELIAHRYEREEQIIGLLRDGQDSIEKMFKVLYPGLHERLHNTARSQIRAHLQKLEKDGKVSSIGENRYLLS